MDIKIGFIGQGWIGKHYADDFEARGYAVVRYALEEPYVNNKAQLSSCDIVFIAVPTPTTPEGFSYEAVRSALEAVPKGKIAVVKSTMLPGTTETLQAAFADRFVLHSPEFLVEKTAAEDAAKPKRNLIGIPKESAEYRTKAAEVLAVLPTAPHSQIMTAREAELTKYAGNCFLYTKVVFMNILHDYVTASGADWEAVREAMIHDPRIGASHTNPVHQSGHDDTVAKTPKRGAGGHCFIKDFEALRQNYELITEDPEGKALLAQFISKNNQLLRDSGKDLDILAGVYGEKAHP